MAQQIEIGEFTLEIDGDKLIVRDAAGWIVETANIAETDGALRLPNGEVLNLAEILPESDFAGFATASGHPSPDMATAGSGIYQRFANGPIEFQNDSIGALEGTEMSFLLGEVAPHRQIDFTFGDDKEDSEPVFRSNHGVSKALMGLTATEHLADTVIDGPSLVVSPTEISGSSSQPVDLSFGSRSSPDIDATNTGESIGGSNGNSHSASETGIAANQSSSDNANGGGNAGGAGNSEPHDDNGNGNDVGQVDPSNPGNGNAGAAAGNGNGNSSGVGNSEPHDDNGNDVGHFDPSNPGNGNAGAAAENGNGNSSGVGNSEPHDDNGNGNDVDHFDPSNPGNGNAGAAAWNGNGNSSGAGNSQPHDDNGHGNDVDHFDPSNPGNGNAGADVALAATPSDTITIADLVSFDSDESFVIASKMKSFGHSDALIHSGEGIDIIDATSGANQTITLSIDDVLTIADGDHHLTIMGDKGDVVNLSGGANGTWHTEVHADTTIYSWISNVDPTHQAVVEVSNQVQANIS
jgi:hypothetical protein